MDRQLLRSFPRLSPASSQITSPKTPGYNCIAWAAEDSTRWWWPQTFAFWPPGIARQETVDAFVAAFRTLGYCPCADGGLKTGYQKVALYVDAQNRPTHMSRQLSDGKWTSKMGRLEDIQHDEPGLVGGSSYGEVAIFLERLCQA